MASACTVWPRASGPSNNHRRLNLLSTPNGSACCSSTKPPFDSKNVLIIAKKCARMRFHARVEEVNYRAVRGLDRALFLKLSSNEWIRKHRNCLITGKTGVGKTWLACALGDKACREDFSVMYYRMPRLFAALALVHGDGRYAKLLRALSRIDLLVFDDWGPEVLTAEQRRDLLEIVEDRYDRHSLLIISQIPVTQWYDMIGNPTLADAILDLSITHIFRLPR